MIIHKLLICITAAIPLGFNLSLIMMPYISLHCDFIHTNGGQTCSENTCTLEYFMYNVCDNVSARHKERASFDVFFGWSVNWGRLAARWDCWIKLPVKTAHLPLQSISLMSVTGRWSLCRKSWSTGWEEWTGMGLTNITNPLSGISLDRAGILSGHLVLWSQWDRGTKAEFSYTGARAVAPSQYKIDLQSLLHKFLKCHRLLCPFFVCKHGVEHYHRFVHTIALGKMRLLLFI